MAVLKMEIVRYQHFLMLRVLEQTDAIRLSKFKWVCGGWTIRSEQQPAIDIYGKVLWIRGDRHKEDNKTIEADTWDGNYEESLYKAEALANELEAVIKKFNMEIDTDILSTINAAQAVDASGMFEVTDMNNPNVTLPNGDISFDEYYSYNPGIRR